MIRSPDSPKLLRHSAIDRGRQLFCCTSAITLVAVLFPSLARSAPSMVRRFHVSSSLLSVDIVFPHLPVVVLFRSVASLLGMLHQSGQFVVGFWRPMCRRCRALRGGHCAVMQCHQQRVAFSKMRLGNNKQQSRSCKKSFMTALLTSVHGQSF